MRNGRSKTANARYAPERTEREFPKGVKGIVFCDTCGITYYKKAWHHNLRHFKSFEKDVPVVFRTCPACQMIKNKQFEGRVSVVNVPSKFQGEVERLIRGYGEVTTTENQLAQKLARKIAETFKAARVAVSHSASPSDVAFITVTFS